MTHSVTDIALIGQLTQRTVALVLAGGRGTRLNSLTDGRAKPAVYFGSRFRIIDFTLSNCINSGLRRVGVITQYQAHSLLRHIQHGWSFLHAERNEFVDLLPARQQLEAGHWYRGTADAVYQNKDIMQRHYRPEYVVILAGDHIYKMNYAQMLLDHVKSGARCTVGCIEVPREQAHAFGIMAVDEQYKITRFEEKPAHPAAMPGDPQRSLASMGIYIFNADYLYQALEDAQTDPETHFDFGQDIIPAAVRAGVAYAHPFGRSCMGFTADGEAYWRDVGTLDAYWEANIDLISTPQRLDPFDPNWPIISKHAQLAPARFKQSARHVGNVVENALIGGGCVIDSAQIHDAILSSRVDVAPEAHIQTSVLLPDVYVGRGCRLQRCVIDRGCRLPDGLVIGEDPQQDARYFYRSEKGIVLVTQEALAALPSIRRAAPMMAVTA